MTAIIPAASLRRKRTRRHTLSSLYLNVTDRCNLRCDYCSAASSPEGQQMLEVEHAVSEVRRWIEDAALSSLLLVFIGGEPTLWGIDRLVRVCEEARRAASHSGKHLSIGIQSNAVRIDDAFIDWCERFDIEPSFSLDGVPTTSDVHRGHGVKTLRNLRKIRDRGIRFGVIVVLTRTVAARLDDTLEFFRREGFTKVRVNTAGEPPNGRALDRANADEILGAKMAIFRHMERWGEAGVRERNLLRQLEWFDASIVGRTPRKSHCETLACGAGRETAVINPDGGWNMCAEKSMTNGLASGPTREAIGAVAETYWAGQRNWHECEGCAARHICDHGCAAYHHGSHEAYATECDATRALFRFLVRERLIGRSRGTSEGK